MKTAQSSFASSSVCVGSHSSHTSRCHLWKATACDGAVLYQVLRSAKVSIRLTRWDGPHPHSSAERPRRERFDPTKLQCRLIGQSKVTRTGASSCFNHRVRARKGQQSPISALVRSSVSVTDSRHIRPAAGFVAISHQETPPFPSLSELCRVGSETCPIAPAAKTSEEFTKPAEKFAAISCPTRVLAAPMIVEGSLRTAVAIDFLGTVLLLRVYLRTGRWKCGLAMFPELTTTLYVPHL